MSKSAEPNSPTSEGLLSSSEKGKESITEERVQLKKELGLIDAVGIIVGIVVGSGIFVSPKGVLLYSGSIGFGLIVWIISGLLSTIGALCYSELGCMIPKSGGDYAYLSEVFGSLPAFLYMWSAFIVIMPAGNAVTAITFAQYLLQPLWPDCSPPFELTQIVATCLICLLTALNCYNVKWVTKVQDGFSFCKVLALVCIVVVGVWQLISGKSVNLENIMEDTNYEPGVIALAFYSGMFSFAGWNYLTFVTEEIKDPYKNLPRAICISLPLVTVIYVLVNSAYYIVLTKEEILSSDAVAVTFGIRTLGYFKWMIPLFVSCSTIGSLNGNIFAASRLFFVGARNGHLPQAISLININKFTPIPSLTILGFLTIILFFVKDLYSLINYATFVESLFILFSIGAVLWLKYKKPNAKRPIKVNAIWPILFFIVWMLLVFLPFYIAIYEVGMGLLIILSGIPVYYILVVQSKNELRWIRVISRKFRWLRKLSKMVDKRTKW